MALIGPAGFMAPAVHVHVSWLLLTVIHHHLCSGLRNPGYITEKGREFIIAFMENRVLVDFPIIKLYATSVSQGPVTVNFSVPLMQDVFPDASLDLQPGEVAVKQYPYDLHMLRDGKHDKGI